MTEAFQEEILALESIYGDDFKRTDKDTCVVSIHESDENVLNVVIKANPTYPATPPTIDLDAPITWIQPGQLSYLLREVAAQIPFEAGSCVLFPWIEWLKENVQTIVCHPKEQQQQQQSAEGTRDAEGQLDCIREETAERMTITKRTPKVYHSDVFVDRKSRFVSHAAYVTSPEDVKAVLEELYADNHIRAATHNMYAYRMWTSKGVLDEYCNDDGERGAGEKMLGILQRLDAQNVMVVVTRWFGGILLGVARFRHICNLTKEIVTSEAFVEEVAKQRGEGGIEK